MRKNNEGLKIFAMAVVVGFVTYLFMQKRNRQEVPEVQLFGRKDLLYSYIKDNQRVKMSELLDVVEDVSERTIRRDLTDLENDGYIKKIGNTKSSEYILVNG